MNLHDFNPTTVEGVETFGRAEGYFYCTDDSSAGHAKIVQAAGDYISAYRNKQIARGENKKAWNVWRTAVILLEHNGASTDLYQRQTNTRWVLDASEILMLAEKIVGAQG